ncbi:MAG: hypothetical protein ACK5HS_02370 [Mycoplasmatales bacterium]
MFIVSLLFSILTIAVYLKMKNKENITAIFMALTFIIFIFFFKVPVNTLIPNVLAPNLFQYILFVIYLIIMVITMENIAISRYAYDIRHMVRMIFSEQESQPLALYLLGLLLLPSNLVIDLIFLVLFFRLIKLESLVAFTIINSLLFFKALSGLDLSVFKESFTSSVKYNELVNNVNTLLLSIIFVSILLIYIVTYISGHKKDSMAFNKTYLFGIIITFVLALLWTNELSITTITNFISVAGLIIFLIRSNDFSFFKNRHKKFPLLYGTLLLIGLIFAVSMYSVNILLSIVSFLIINFVLLKGKSGTKVLDRKNVLSECYQGLLFLTALLLSVSFITNSSINNYDFGVSFAQQIINVLHTANGIPLFNALDLFVFAPFIGPLYFMGTEGIAFSSIFIVVSIPIIFLSYIPLQVYILSVFKDKEAINNRLQYLLVCLCIIITTYVLMLISI